MNRTKDSGRRLVNPTGGGSVSSSNPTCSTEVLSSIVDLICENLQERSKNVTSDDITELQNAVSELQQKIGAFGKSLSSRAKCTIPNAQFETESSSFRPLIATRVDQNNSSAEHQLSTPDDEGNDKVSISEVKQEGPLHERRVSRLSQPYLPPPNTLNVSIFEI